MENFKTTSGEIIPTNQFKSEFRYGAYDVTGGAGSMDIAGNRWVRIGSQGGYGIIKKAHPYTSTYGNTYYR